MGTAINNSGVTFPDGSVQSTSIKTDLSVGSIAMVVFTTGSGGVSTGQSLAGSSIKNGSFYAGGSGTVGTYGNTLSGTWQWLSGNFASSGYNIIGLAKRTA